MDSILYWNEHSLDAVKRDYSRKQTPEQNGPTRTSRALAIVHLAMYDAFNGIAQVYNPYLPDLPAPEVNADIDAAIGTAAFITLCQLYPSQSSLFSAQYQAFLSLIPSPPEAIAAGGNYGKTIAEKLWCVRSTDRHDIDDSGYRYREGRSFHRPDPLDLQRQPPVTPHWGRVTPFALPNVTEFRARPYPPLDSASYRQAFNDVKEKGALEHSTRTPEETAIGLYWAYDGAKDIGTPPRLYNQIVRVIAEKLGIDRAGNARLFALVNMAMADAGIQCWESKYHYDLWRPAVGIPEADPAWGKGDGDSNPETEGDPFWLPLGAPKTNEPGATSTSPSFPAYPSGHATFGAAALDIVRLFYDGNDDISFDFVSDELNGESVDVKGFYRTYHKRSFQRLSDAIVENGRSRVYLGVHWQFDADAGIESGKKIAQYIYDNTLRPLA